MAASCVNATLKPASHGRRQSSEVGGTAAELVPLRLDGVPQLVGAELAGRLAQLLLQLPDHDGPHVLYRVQVRAHRWPRNDTNLKEKTDCVITIVPCTSDIQDFVYERAEDDFIDIMFHVISGAARALVTGLKLATEGPPGRVGPLPKIKASHFFGHFTFEGPFSGLDWTLFTPIWAPKSRN